MLLTLFIAFIVLLHTEEEGKALGFKVSINNFTDSVNNVDWRFDVLRGFFNPFVNGSGALVLANGQTQVQTASTYLAGLYQGGATPFRFDLECLVHEIVTLIVGTPSTSWLKLDFWNDPQTQACFRDVSQYQCFFPLDEVKDDRYHKYSVEFHPTAMQVFLFVDDGTSPRAQITVTELPPPLSSISIEAYNGDYPSQPTALKSFAFDSDTFIPTTISSNAAFLRPNMVPTRQFVAQGFVNGWKNSPGVNVRLDQTIVHNMFPVGASWVLNPILITSSVRVNFTFQFEPFMSNNKYGLMFVIQNHGVNINGNTGWGFGFASWTGFGVAFSPEPTTGAIYLYDNTILPSDPFTLLYPKRTCDSLLGTFVDFYVSLDIGLYGGNLQGSIQNGTGGSCQFSFTFNPCLALQALDLNTRTGWVGFTSSLWDDNGQYSHLYSFQVNSKFPFHSTLASFAVEN